LGVWGHIPVALEGGHMVVVEVDMREGENKAVVVGKVVESMVVEVDKLLEADYMVDILLVVGYRVDNHHEVVHIGVEDNNFVEGDNLQNSFLYIINLQNGIYLKF
jgi:hypothetical protein